MTGDHRYRENAEGALGTAAVLATRAPRFVSWALAAAEAAQTGPAEVAVVGSSGDPVRDLLLKTALAHAMPGSAVVVGPPDMPDAGIPLLAARPLVEGQAAAYVCRQFVCRRPVTDVTALVSELTSRVQR
jgi:uncharacterized protein YyaL (SSP411 family)